MKVGILGSGIVGRVLAGGFIKHGHQAVLGTRDRNKQELADWIRETPGAKVASFDEAARFGDIIVLAALGRAVENIIDIAGPANFSGKTVIDATNPLSDEPPVNGILKYTTGPNESLGEQIQAKLLGARLVKAFNSVGNGLMINPQFPGGAPTIFYCGNNEEAKAEVAGIIRQFGWEPYDCGTIVSARALEPCACCGVFPGSCETTGSMRSRC